VREARYREEGRGKREDERGRRKREEGRGKREEGRGKREEGRGKKEEGRGKREEGRGKREEGRRGKGKSEKEDVKGRGGKVPAIGNRIVSLGEVLHVPGKVIVKGGEARAAELELEGEVDAAIEAKVLGAILSEVVNVALGGRESSIESQVVVVDGGRDGGGLEGLLKVVVPRVGDARLVEANVLVDRGSSDAVREREERVANGDRLALVVRVLEELHTNTE